MSRIFVHDVRSSDQAVLDCRLEALEFGPHHRTLQHKGKFANSRRITTGELSVSLYVPANRTLAKLRVFGPAALSADCHFFSEMPGILTRSSSNLNGNKFKTVLGIGSIQNNNHSAAYDAEHEDDDEDAARPSSPPAVKPRGRKLRARIPPDQRHAESTMPPPVDIKHNRAARPVRMDAQDGPWSVSVAEASPRSLTIYIKSMSAPAASPHGLTLTLITTFEQPLHTISRSPALHMKSQNCT
jgi:hypothetical protein